MAEPAILEFTASDGYVWNYRQFSAHGNTCGSVVVLHGIQSHGGWYLESSQWLADRGWEVSLLDRRGSGLNHAARGDSPSFRRLLDDVAEFLTTLARPRVLIGISWGGKLGVAFQRRHPGLIDRLVLIGPGICPRVKPSLATRLAILVARAIAPTKSFAIPLSDPALFTANPERQQFVREDLLALRQATARLLFESFRLDIYLRHCSKFVNCPTLVLLAGQDRIIDIERTRRYVSRFRGPVEIIEYQAAHHTLEFEFGGPPHLSDMRCWLAK